MKTTIFKFANWLSYKLKQDQGDVPGWVLITVMSAAIVLALWAVAQEALVSLFDQAVSQFNGK